MSIAVRKPRGALVVNDAERAFFDDVLAGLSEQPKRVPPKYFYDHVGSVIPAHYRVAGILSNAH